MNASDSYCPTKSTSAVPVFFVVLCTFLSAVQVLAFQAMQVDSIPGAGKTVRMAAGPEYEAGWLHRLFFGSHWRDLWVTPIDVNVLDLRTYEGGLTPVRRGGGFQTKSLRLEASNGKIWKFRSVNKDPTKTLPPELQESLVLDLLKDQISSSNPLGTLIVTPLLNGVGVLTVQPFLYVLPDDEQLGEFRNEFGGTLGTLQVYPTGDEEGEPGFAGSDKVIGTYPLFKRLQQKSDERVDAGEFLKARLMDIFVGDWDRHDGQWRWARFTENDNTVWKPIPSDRDQAFARFDGVVPWLATQVVPVVPQLNHFSEAYRPIQNSSWSGRFLDRRFLTSLDQAAWDSVAMYVQSRLTDSLIEAAVGCLPREYYAKEGGNIETALKTRRDNFQEMSHDYYSFLADEVDIWGTDKQEYVDINRFAEDSVEVSFFRRDKKSGGRKGNPFYHRVFDGHHTSEIRVYLEDGDDLAAVRGTVDNSILVRVIGGKGENELIDSSRVNGHFLGLVPWISAAETKTRFYDSSHRSQLTIGPSTVAHRDNVKEPETDTEKYEPVLRDWGRDIYLIPFLEYNSDFGVLLSGGLIDHDYGFRNDPYTYRADLFADYAPTVNKFRAKFLGEFYRWVKGARVIVNARASTMEILHFYGFGNETVRDKNLEDQDYYDVNQEHYFLSSDIVFPVSNGVSFSLGGAIKYLKTDSDHNSLLEVRKPYGFGKMALASVVAGFTVDTRDFSKAATKGLLLSLSATYFPKIFDNQHEFGQARGDIRMYHTVQILTPATLALRLQGEKLWGIYPVYEAAFIGGVHSLRGFSLQRFAGDAAISGSLEARFLITRYNFVVPTSFGFLGFGEAGRVFLSGESSSTWHNGYGGGVWFSFLYPAATLSISLGKSVETLGLFFGLGFTF